MINHTIHNEKMSKEKALSKNEAAKEENNWKSVVI